jgi:alpha-galactosidase
MGTKCKWGAIASLMIAGCFLAGCGTPTEIAADSDAARMVWLDELDMNKAVAGWGETKANQSIDGNALRINAQTYERGVGTHAPGYLVVKLDKGTTRFQAVVGIDAEVGDKPGSVKFIVAGDGKTLWESDVLGPKDGAATVDLDVSNVRELRLIIDDVENNLYDHADWANAVFEVVGATPVTVDLPKPEPYILTPKPGPEPKITGPKIFGVRPGSPVLFTATATGDRPMEFSAQGLPAGLRLDVASGRITGQLDEPGEYRIVLTAQNTSGRAERPFRIKVGDTICLTPPMGWNSWNCWARAIDDEKIRASAKSLVESGLIHHGWSYVNIDDCWMRQLNTKNQDQADFTQQGWHKPMVSDDPRLGGVARDEAGNLLPNKNFPDMPALTEYIHGLGLKTGIYISPGPWTCQHYVGSWKYEEQDAAQFAEWGFDYLKYDWCGYSKVSGRSLPELKKPYEVMRDALALQRRDIVYSICQYGWGDVHEWGEEMNGNCWRTTGDIVDTWKSLYAIGFSQDNRGPYAKPGHWNDPDMLIVGNVGWGPSLHPTRLTPDEQYTHISLWCLLSAPLLIGCDLTTMDDFTLNLLTNDEVLDINQDPLGRQARKVAESADRQIWAKDMEDGSKAVGLFNLNAFDPQKVTVDWSDLGIAGKQVVRDLWRQKDVETSRMGYTVEVPPHGVVLIKITSAGNNL